MSADRGFVAERGLRANHRSLNKSRRSSKVLIPALTSFDIQSSAAELPSARDTSQTTALSITEFTITFRFSVVAEPVYNFFNSAIRSKRHARSSSVKSFFIARGRSRNRRIDALFVSVRNRRGRSFYFALAEGLLARTPYRYAR